MYIPQYSQYNLNYQRILLRSKESYKRLKLKIGHILSTKQTEEKSKSTPNKDDIRNIKNI